MSSNINYDQQLCYLWLLTYCVACKPIFLIKKKMLLSFWDFPCKKKKLFKKELCFNFFTALQRNTNPHLPFIHISAGTRALLLSCTPGSESVTSRLRGHSIFPSALAPSWLQLPVSLFAARGYCSYLINGRDLTVWCDG